MSRIVSLQSSVAYGHVGNSAAVFPLMRMGSEVLPICTVVLAASTGYGPARGAVLTPDQVGDIVSGMADVGALGGVDAVLSGYLGTPQMGARVLESVLAVRRHSPRARYCCDPVLGDVGRGLFVEPGILEFLRDEALPLADIATPNHFELNLLLGRDARTLAEIVDAARALRDKGPGVVVVTSAAASDLPADQAHTIAVDASGAWLVSAPRLDRGFTGCGDVMAAVFLHHVLRVGVAAALSRTASSVHGLLTRTAELGSRELALVSAQDEFVSPTHVFEARLLPG